MKKLLIRLLIAVCAIQFMACDKQKIELDVYPKTSGHLTFRLIDIQGRGVSGARLKLIQYTEKYENIELRSVFADDDGFFDFGELNAATYRLETNSAKYDGIATWGYYNFQIIGGTNADLEVKDSEFFPMW